MSDLFSHSNWIWRWWFQLKSSVFLLLLHHHIVVAAVRLHQLPIKQSIWRLFYRLNINYTLNNTCRRRITMTLVVIAIRRLAVDRVAFQHRHNSWQMVSSLLVEIVVRSMSMFLFNSSKCNNIPNTIQLRHRHHRFHSHQIIIITIIIILTVVLLIFSIMW